MLAVKKNSSMKSNEREAERLVRRWEKDNAHLARMNDTKTLSAFQFAKKKTLIYKLLTHTHPLMFTQYSTYKIYYNTIVLTVLHIDL